MYLLSSQWAALTADERSELVILERAEKHSSGYGGGGYIPDDCCECGFCGTPHLGTGMCPPCSNRLQALITLAKEPPRG